MRVLISTFLAMMVGSILGCSSLRTTESLVPSVIGKWRIHQTNAGGQEFTGTLNLQKEGSHFSGSVSWNNYIRAAITDGTVSTGPSAEQGSIVSFVIEYDSGLRGKYYATLSFDGKELFDGTTVVIEGGSDSGTWNATLIED